MYFTNITGGEPFIRTDLKDIVRELYKKSDRIVISTNGFFTDPLTSEIATNVIGSMTHFVKLFLILSGFGMCCGYYERFKSGKVNLEKFYIRRFEKNLPFFALLVCIDTLFSIKTVVWRDVFSSLTMAFNLMPSHDMSVIGVGWTLGVIFAFYFMFPFYVFLY